MPRDVSKSVSRESRATHPHLTHKILMISGDGGSCPIETAIHHRLSVDDGEFVMHQIRSVVMTDLQRKNESPLKGGSSRAWLLNQRNSGCKKKTGLDS